MAQDLSGRGQPQQLVLTLFGAYARPRDRQIWSGGLVRLLGEVGISPGAARVTLTRLAARDLLTRSKAGRLVHYAITPRTAAILAEGDSRIFTFGQERDRADVWTVLWHTIPEERKHERATLTRRLRFLGFGPLQDGVWLAPRDHEQEVVRVLSELALADHAALLVGRPAAMLGPAALANTAWDLDDLASRYGAFVGKFVALDDPAARSAVTGAEAFAAHATLVHEFRQFPTLDPEIPGDLIAPPPQRAHAVKLFETLYAALGPPAQRYFDQVTTP